MAFPLLPVAFGAASAAQGIFSAFGNYQSDVAQTNARNRQIADDYKFRQQLRVSRQQAENASYRAKVLQSAQNIDSAYRAAQYGYTAEQRKLSELANLQAFQSQDAQIALASALGTARASGMTGKTMDRLKTSIRGAEGRNTAIRSRTKQSAFEAYTQNTTQIRDRLKAGINRAYAPVMFGPAQMMPLPKPTFAQGPSQSSLFLNAGSALLGGIQSGVNFGKMIK